MIRKVALQDALSPPQMRLSGCIRMAELTGILVCWFWGCDEYLDGGGCHLWYSMFLSRMPPPLLATFSQFLARGFTRFRSVVELGRRVQCSGIRQLWPVL